MKQNSVIAIVLIVLLAFLVFQSFQLNSLEGKVKEGSLTISSASQKVTTASDGGSSSKSTGAALPSNIQNLPQMVGGC